MTPDVIRKLEEAFTMGCSDREACLYADIGYTTLYEYQQRNPDFAERKKTLKESVGLRARLNVAEEITKKKDVDTSKWYLERKKKDEFSIRQEMTGADGKAIRLAISQDQLTAIAREVVNSQRTEVGAGGVSIEHHPVLDSNVPELQSVPAPQTNSEST